MLTFIRVTSMSALIALAFVTSTLPARADFGLSFRVAVGAAPPPPTVALNAGSQDYAEPCGDRKLHWLVYGAQVFNAFVVSNAVHKGAIGATVFGTSKTALPYIGQQAAEDALIQTITRRWSCRARSLIQGALGAGALSNAANTEFPR